MQVSLKYGTGKLELDIPDKAQATLLAPASLPVLDDPAGDLARALDDPLGAPRLEDMDPPRSVAVAVPDETRPAPVALLLPVVLDRLFTAFPHLSPDNVTVIVGGGLHDPMDEAGLARVVPTEAARGCRVVAHDARRSPMRSYGNTSRGTPVDVNALFGDADLRIVLGLLDPHPFQGFTGGAKGAVIGCGAAETIHVNHSLLVHDQSKVGVLEANPARQDLNEAGRLIGVHLAVNVVLDGSKRVVRLLAGEPESVLREGARTCSQVYGVRLAEPFDMVVASCGGHPKDINLYQAQKGFSLAALALKPKGKLLLLAACPQGVGDDPYFNYVQRFANPAQLMEGFLSQKFRVGPHKAYLFSRTQVQCEAVVASQLDADTLALCHLAKADPQQTINQWIEESAGRPRVGIVPNANTTYFVQE